MGQFGPEALLGADGRPLPGASVTVPDGYTASVDGAGNLTVSGPAADAVPTTITPPDGSPFTVNLRVEQAVADVLTRGDARATYITVVGTPAAPITDPATARPAGAVIVYWVMAKAVTPTNAAAGDIIWNAA